jgi:acetoin utilization deacetylase AcuC-like enzyme
MKIIYSPECLEYQSSGHPESPERVRAAHRLLRKDHTFAKPRPCSGKELLLVHTQNLVDMVRNSRISDPDTPALPGMYRHACLSAGAALEAMRFALKGEKAFSLMRPPGHHAGRDFLGGFCYFNSIAVAVSKALLKAGRAAILDIDCHHGNGTQDIFLRNRDVLYISLHQSPLYPGTGLESQDNCINFPLPPGTREKQYLSVLRKALTRISEFRPGLVAVSAGFDTYRGDTISNLSLEKESYLKIGEAISSLEFPGFAVLEGGYSTELAECVKNFLSGYGRYDFY